MPNKDFVFTSESVSEGHPDKIADQISDAILDACLTKDKNARVACETFVKTGLVLVGGEISTQATIEVEDIIRKVIRDIGYTHSQIGFDADSCAILSSLGKQSIDIAAGINQDKSELQGAGDQGLMFGYATNETVTLMPAPIAYAHLLMKKQAELRKKNILPWLRPDAKTQLSFQYLNSQPTAITHLVFSTQHHPDINHPELVEAVIEEIIKPVIPANWLKHTKYLINPTKRFVIGGPQGDCGLTGRKIIVDTYGGMSRHGGGCFSGKDPSKVDRSGAYMARYIAKNIVAAKLADRCEIQISYAIGIAEPISINIDTFGTGKITDDKLCQLVKSHFDLRPFKIIEKLNLLEQLYQPTATYGHFGRDDLNLSWEKTDRTEELKQGALIK